MEFLVHEALQDPEVIRELLEMRDQWVNKDHLDLRGFKAFRVSSYSLIVAVLSPEYWDIHVMI